MPLELWTDKYSPKTLSDYVFRDDAQRRMIEKWVSDGAAPNALFSGDPGVGKTTLLWCLMNDLGIEKGNILYLNASKDNDVETVRKKIIDFAGMLPFGDDAFKYVLLDEMDGMSRQAQGILRGVINDYSKTTRFLGTCNYLHLVIDPMRDRLAQGFHVTSLDREAFMRRMLTVLDQEGADFTKFDTSVIGTFVEAFYPNLRVCLQKMQQNFSDGILRLPESDDVDPGANKLRAVELFQQGKFTEARQVIVETTPPEGYRDWYRFLYRNLGLFGDTEEKKNLSLLKIRDGLVNHENSADPEICLSACIVELDMIRRQ